MSNDYARAVTSILDPRDHQHRTSSVRDATDADVPAIQQIYAHYVRHTLSTFEEEPPTVDEMRSRQAAVLRAGLPYLVAEAGGAVVGYSYATVYRPRPAYRYTIEDSVYVAPDAQQRGVGRLLLSALIERCAAGPWRQMIAVIGNSNNTGSVTLHEKLGFRYVGTLTATGYKFGQWIDTALMQREIGLGQHTAPELGSPEDRQP
ncbi:GNAT family N-acetyltransferase [Phytoactinopolyspora mesophila]|uniref:GNAT family N-acetyltransferase n=1 Tax=Phytoactinopolyspora mesophila TaxID=2650750 RepID=A0A7K3M6K8_9ACTN|nr:GNAT family N-acetyltransferase [Phytoactinopolyspora mesophila]NDL58677.1 GNAT family N-acetyltransferase [Phytoactinopolyspora mesophila]